MNNITYAVSVDVNNPIIPYNVYVANVLDSSVRYLEITLYQNGNVITLSNTATATASLVTDDVLVDDSVECTISNNIISVPLEDLQRHGNLDVQVTVTEGTKVLAIPFPIQVRVTPNIAEEAQIDEDSLGSYAEVVQEIAEARNGHNSLDERLNSDASGKEAVINKVQSIGSQSQTFDNVKYPSASAVRNYVNTKTDDLQDYIENELDALDEAKSDKTDTNAQFERLIAVLQRKADSADIPGETQIETIVETYLEEHPSSINTVGMDNLSQNLKQSLAISTITSRNLLRTDMEQGKLFSTNGRNWDDDGGTRSADFTPVEALTQYTFSRSESGYALAVFLYDNEKNKVSIEGMGADYTNKTFITPAGAAFLRFYSLSDSFEILYQLERGDSATEYQSPDFSETKMQLNENYMSGKTVQRLTPKMTDIYVSASFAQNEDGYGVTKFNTIYAANESITDNSEKNRYTIHVADGTYTDLQERYSGIDDSEREAKNYCGIVCKDYVYYEGNVQNPANCVISWDGKTGFSGDIVYSNVSKRAPFHLSNIVRNSLHTHIKGFTFNCKNLRYCLHIETGGAGREVDWLIEQCRFLWGGNPDCTDITGLGSKAALGCGHSPLEHGRFKNCTVNASNGYAYLCHDNSNGTTRVSGILSGADIRFENCDLSNGTIQCQSVKGDGLVDTPYVLSFDDCINIGSVALQISAPATQSVWKVEKGEEKAVKSNTYTKAETDDAVVRNYKDATPDVTFNMHNTKVDAFLQTEAYDSSDYSYSNLPTADSTNWDRPNTTTITIPSGSSKIVFYDTVTRAERVEPTSGTTHTIDNLIPNRNYAYTVRKSDGSLLSHGIIKAIGQVRMINAGGDDAETDRTFNIRDLGGWTATGGKLKYGLVYRGGELNGSISISSAQQAFFKDVLGIRHEIDLRDSGEPGVGATALGCGVNYYHLATGRSPYVLLDNDTYAKKRADVIKQIAKNIKNGEPTYIHCSAGADRTGVMCVFLKAICGVSQSDIDRDQELSYYSYQADPQRVRKRNNMWANGHRVMINGTGAEDYSQPYINNMEGSSFQDKIVRFLLRSGVTIDELNDIRFGLIDGNPTALTTPYGNATITKNLSHVFIDSEDTSVKLYQPFEARVLPNDGYILTSVSVTMGGTDITSTAYNAERFLIPRVTGGIIITASATDVVIPDVSGKADKATTLAGYGINDAYTKAEVDALENNKENISNKLSSEAGIDEDSTDNEYPSAKAVYDYGTTITNNIEDVKAYIGYTDGDILGLHADFENNQFTRLGAAVGLTAGQDFNVFPMYGGRRRCNVANDGTINAYYGDESYTEDGSNGQVMVYQPVFWYKVVPLDIDRNTSGVGYHIRKANYYVSSKPVLGFKRHPLFYDEQGNPVDYVLLSAYEGSMYDVSEEAYVNDSVDTSVSYGAGDLLCSVAGKKPISGKLNGIGTKVNFETMANNIGSGWHLNTIKAESANQLLMLIELGRFNTQAAIGQGVVSQSGASNASSLTGSTANLGNGTGQATETIAESAGTETVNTTSGKLSISYRGVENPWGNIWKHINGINLWGDGHMGGGQVFICDDFSFNESKHDGNYQSAGFTVSNGDGYVSAFGYGDEDYDWLFMPSETTGNSSIPVGDYLYRTSNLNGYRIAMLGGSWRGGDNAGGFCWHCNSTPGNQLYALGGRLLYVPTATV